MAAKILMSLLRGIIETGGAGLEGTILAVVGIIFAERVNQATALSAMRGEDFGEKRTHRSAQVKWSNKARM